MIAVILKDSYGNELALNDVMLVRFPNPKIFFIGKLTLHDNQFVIMDEAGKYQQLRITGWEGYSIEKIGNLDVNYALKKEFGRHEFILKADAKKFIKEIENGIAKSCH